MVRVKQAVIDRCHTITIKIDGDILKFLFNIGTNKPDIFLWLSIKITNLKSWMA